jgi:hypothetical protein
LSALQESGAPTVNGGKTRRHRLSHVILSGRWLFRP